MIWSKAVIPRTGKYRPRRNSIHQWERFALHWRLESHPSQRCPFLRLSVCLYAIRFLLQHCTVQQKASVRLIESRFDMMNGGMTSEI